MAVVMRAQVLWKGDLFEVKKKELEGKEKCLRVLRWDMDRAERGRRGGS